MSITTHEGTCGRLEYLMLDASCKILVAKRKNTDAYKISINKQKCTSAAFDGTFTGKLLSTNISSTLDGCSDLSENIVIFNN